MPLDADYILSAPAIETTHTYSKRDTILYALGVGASELRFTYEQDLQALPTMAVVLAYPGFIWRNPHYSADWERVLHGENEIVLHAALPPEGTVRGVTTLGPLVDKGAGKGAICYTTRQIYDAGDRLLATVSATIFLRGDGGFGGTAEVAREPRVVPDRPCDLSHVLPTSEQQAKLYRLSGDDNPLHIDPEVARKAGFDRPILHGLCTYAVAGRSLLAALCDDRPERLKRFGVRFTRPVFPGETLRTDIWLANGQAAFRTTATERDVIVLDCGYVEYT